MSWSPLVELDRDRHFGTDPRSSRLWPDAPAHLKRDFFYGRLDPESFWDQLERWLRFEERAA